MSRARHAAETAGALLLVGGLCIAVLAAGPPVALGLWLSSWAVRR